LKMKNMQFYRYSSAFKTCAVPDVPFPVPAQLHDNGDFDRTVCIAVNCAMDADCSTANAETVPGILNPDGHGLVMRSSAVRRLTAPPDIDGLFDLRERCHRKIVRTVEVAVRNNLHWSHFGQSRLTGGYHSSASLL